jgi:hypothetical protein
MIVGLKIIIVIFSVFAALSLLCAVRIGRRATPPADPFALPFGEMPAFTAEQLDRIRPRDFSADPLRRSFATRTFILDPDETVIAGRVVKNSAGLALRRADADGGGHVPSWLAPISRFLRGRR